MAFCSLSYDNVNDSACCVSLMPTGPVSLVIGTCRYCSSVWLGAFERNSHACGFRHSHVQQFIALHRRVWDVGYVLHNPLFRGEVTEYTTGGDQAIQQGSISDTRPMQASFLSSHFLKALQRPNVVVPARDF